jgi:hypothetical protein
MPGRMAVRPNDAKIVRRTGMQDHYLLVAREKTHLSWELNSDSLASGISIYPARCFSTAGYAVPRRRSSRTAWSDVIDVSRLCGRRENQSDIFGGFPWPRLFFLDVPKETSKNENSSLILTSLR